MTFAVGQPVGGTVRVSASAGGPASPAGLVSGGQASLLSARPVNGKASQTVREGEAVPIDGTALRPDGMGADGAVALLQSSPHNRNRWTTIRTIRVAGPGFVSAVVRPKQSSDYRLHIAASGNEVGSTSARFTLIVRPVLTAVLSKPFVRHGQTIGLNVVVPGHGGQIVLVQRFVHHKWVDFTKARLGSAGRRSVLIRPLSKGHLLYRFVKAADAYHAAVTSKALPVHVV